MREQLNPKPILFDLHISKISAGFPSPADEYIEGKLDLNKYLISNPPATFFMKARSDSMIGSGIFPGDILIIDRSKKAYNGKIVIASINGELLVRRFFTDKDRMVGKVEENKIILKAENPKYRNIILKESDGISIWGIVTFVLHQV